MKNEWRNRERESDECRIRERKTNGYGGTDRERETNGEKVRKTNGKTENKLTDRAKDVNGSRDRRTESFARTVEINCRSLKRENQEAGD